MSASRNEAIEKQSERQRRGQLLLRLARVMGALTLFAFAVSLLEPSNSKLISVVFYGTTALVVFVVMLLTRRGRVVFAAWLLGSFFWLLIAVALLFFGGLQGENAATFCVCVLLIGGVVGGRAAVVVGVVSSLCCALIAFLEHTQRMPPQLGVYSPINAWSGITVTLLLTSVLLHASLESLRRAHAEAGEIARERDRALAKSIEAQKMEVVGNLSGGIAHDFNNLLTVIIGSTTLVRSETQNASEPVLRYLNDIDAATSRATLMTRQLLSFSGGRVNELSTIDLAQVVRSMGTMLPRLLGSRIEIRVLTPDVTATIIASRAGLEQILLNLSVNARDAMPDGGQLTLELSIEDDSAILTTSDTGVGMDPEVLARVFEPFFTTKNTGTGLGLATVMARVEQFGGHIEARSERGHGSTFVITFPLHSGTSPRVMVSKPEIAREPTFRGRALLVEDDGLVRKTVASLLEHAGFEVTAVANGAEALGVMREPSPFAVVVSDLSMPLMDGGALVKKLQARWPALPIVMISGNADAALAAALPSNVRVLEKPLDEDRLIVAIRAAIDKTED